jgi:hypothetical protein
MAAGGAAGGDNDAGVGGDACTGDVLVAGIAGGAVTLGNTVDWSADGELVGGTGDVGIAVVMGGNCADPASSPSPTSSESLLVKNTQVLGAFCSGEGGY